MSCQLPYRILLAEDDRSVRESLALVLVSAGYDVTVAEHGVDAIFLLQKMRPHLVIYELNLPHLRDHDFLAIVRMRFPQVSVIAISSSASEGKLPEEIFADAMYIKGHTAPETLLQIASELIETAGARTIDHERNGAQAFVANQRARRVRA